MNGYFAILPSLDSSSITNLFQCFDSSANQLIKTYWAPYIANETRENCVGSRNIVQPFF